MAAIASQRLTTKWMSDLEGFLCAPSTLLSLLSSIFYQLPYSRSLFLRSLAADVLTERSTRLRAHFAFFYFQDLTM